jgi:RimJ/RimL family protein N-acetyltransferase
VTSADLPSFVRWLNDPEINRWLAIPSSGPPKSLEQERQWADRARTDPSQLVWTIETHDGRTLGNVTVHLSPDRAEWAELGIFIGEKGEWNRGYGSDAVHTLLGHAFGPLGLHRVFLHSDIENHRAHRTFEKCGFRREGVVKEYRRRWEEGRPYVDAVLMAILAHEHRA